MHNTSPQWIRDLDVANQNHAAALRSFLHSSCRVAKEPCKACSLLKIECLVAPGVSLDCVKGIADGRPGNVEDMCLPRM